MKIYRIGMHENATTDSVLASQVEFAHFSALGTWESLRPPCKACGWHWQVLAEPLLVQWEPSSTVIGDFSWDGPFGYEFVVKESIVDALRKMSFRLRFSQASIVKPDRKRSTVAFPYSGPMLFWGECEAVEEAEHELSGITLLSSCQACGDVRYRFRRDGIVIDKSKWTGEAMFLIASNRGGGPTFVTELGKQLIRDSGLSNIEFTEAGEIAD